MAKFYVISDVHGFYDEMKKALDDAGFDPNDENHWLVSLGDELDRGDQSQEVLDYLLGLPRAIFVKGNHTLLMEEMLNRGYARSHDVSNGTFKAACDLAPNATDMFEAVPVIWSKVKPLFDKEINYLELKNHILVHSFVPLKSLDGRKFEKDPNWRYAHASAWEEAVWGNPYQLAEQGLLPDKTLVFGHFHTSWPRHHYEGKPEFGEGADFSIYHGDGYIAIDGCVAYSGRVNVLVLEDVFMDG